LFKISPFGRNDKEEAEMTKMAVIQSSQVMNRFYAVLAWLDARLMPRSLSTVLLIKARKKNLL